MAPFLVLSAALAFTFTANPSPQLWRSLVEQIQLSPMEGRNWQAQQVRPEMQPIQGAAVSVEVTGKCELPAQEVSWRPAPLGQVKIVNGEWLSIVQLDCSRIAEAVRRIHSSAEPARCLQAALATAMVVVLRHELRHLMRQTREHEATGEYRAALPARDLSPAYTGHETP